MPTPLSRIGGLCGCGRPDSSIGVGGSVCGGSGATTPRGGGGTSTSSVFVAGSATIHAVCGGNGPRTSCAVAHAGIAARAKTVARA
ncbi:MAG: hypothetical protein R3F56_23105 [Planctomycetota bacterium]